MELNGEGLGYHAFPATRGPNGFSSSQERTAWSGFERVLALAKRGDFSGAPDLLAIYADADWMLSDGGPFDPYLRHQFEACGGFDRFEPGKRHFFGVPVPE